MLQVGLIDFDVNFLNFEDPEVLAKLTGDDYESHWKATYGVDFVAKLGQLKEKQAQPVVDKSRLPIESFCKWNSTVKLIFLKT